MHDQFARGNCIESLMHLLWSGLGQIQGRNYHQIKALSNDGHCPPGKMGEGEPPRASPGSLGSVPSGQKAAAASRNVATENKFDPDPGLQEPSAKEAGEGETSSVPDSTKNGSKDPLPEVRVSEEVGRLQPSTLRQQEAVPLPTLHHA